MDNTLLDLQNSSYPTQPHSIIAKYLWNIFKPAVAAKPVMQAPSHVKILHGEKERIIENDLKNILSHEATGLDAISVHILKEVLEAAFHKKN